MILSVVPLGRVMKSRVSNLGLELEILVPRYYQQLLIKSITVIILTYLIDIEPRFLSASGQHQLYIEWLWPLQLYTQQVMCTCTRML